LNNANSAWNDYENTIQDVAYASGTNISNLDDLIQDLAASNEDIRDAAYDATEAIWD
jgi:hypothetical protein